jgi:acyl-CoA thioesterase-2
VPTLLDRLIDRLRLEETAPDRFRGGSGSGGVTLDNRLFGGLVAAQAAAAAARTVPGVPMHSLHAYFLRPGRPERDMEFRVQRIKEGRNFQARTVEVRQRDQLILHLQASFTEPVTGVRHQAPMPPAPGPDESPNRDQLRGRGNWAAMPIDVRMATEITANQPLPPEQQVWLKPSGLPPEDPLLHLALLVYASDRTLLETAWRPHADQGALAGASLDHSMWFHETPRFDDWLLYVMDSPAAHAGRGLALGGLYSRDGRRLASVAQEGLLRFSPR